MAPAETDAPAIADPTVRRWIRIRSRALPALLLCAIALVLVGALIYHRTRLDDRDLGRNGATAIGRVVSVSEETRGSVSTYAVNFVATGTLRQVTLRGPIRVYTRGDRVTLTYDRSNPYRADAPGLRSTSSERPRVAGDLLMTVGAGICLLVLSLLAGLLRVRRVAADAPLKAWTTASVDVVPGRLGGRSHHEATLARDGERLRLSLDPPPKPGEQTMVAVRGHTAIVVTPRRRAVQAARLR